MRALDVCIVGHITRDTIVDDDGTRTPLRGGVPTYAAPVFASGGLRTAIVTRGSGEVINETRQAIPGVVLLAPRFDRQATEFTNIYSADGPEDRRQEVTARASRIGASDVDSIVAAGWMMGPLLDGDIDLAAYPTDDAVVALDIQGYCRGLDGIRVVPRRSPEIADAVSRATIVKASRGEAEIATGKPRPEAAIAALRDLGAREVLITDGEAGYWLGTDDGIQIIEPTRAPLVIDRTGCGDTFLAAYLMFRLADCPPVQAARSAAAAAAAKAARRGPLLDLPADLPNISWIRDRAIVT